MLSKVDSETTMNSLPLLFCQSSLNTVSSTISSSEECMLLGFIPHPIFSLPVIKASNSRYFGPFSISLEGSSYQELTVAYGGTQKSTFHSNNPSPVLSDTHGMLLSILCI